MAMRAALPGRPSLPARGLMVLAVILALLALSFGSTAAQTPYPALTGRVTDAAALFKPDDRAALEAKLKDYEDRTSTQVVVATIPSLKGEDIADYANGLFRTWKLGQDKASNGVLLLVAPNDRRVRIEVGYGLEGALTDAQARAIIASVIAPRFRAGDYAAGISAGVDAIIASLAGSEEWLPKPKRPPEQDPIAWPVIVFYLVVFFIFFVLPIIRARSQGAITHRLRNGNWVVLPSPSIGWGSGGFSGGGGFGSGFSGGGGSSGGGGASGSW